MSKREPLTCCCVCGEKSRARFEGKEYCKKHFSQMYRHGHILERTIYDTYEEAVLARITKEKELCGEYGANKDLYYVLGIDSPINELKLILNKAVN